MINKDRDIDTFLDFENQIRLEALSLHEALEYKEKSGKQIFVVGIKIGAYTNTLRELGFSDMWQLTDDVPSQEFLEVYGKLLKEKSAEKDTLFMYAYIDHVLKNTDADIMTFLPDRSYLLAIEQLAGPTFDEVTRILELFSEYSDRIHFVTGLFKYLPKEFDKLVKSSTLSRLLL